MKVSVRLFLFVIFVGLGLIVVSKAWAGDGHDAGYEWAQEHDIRDTGYDNGNSDSFNEGVREYAEEMQEEEPEE